MAIAAPAEISTEEQESQPMTLQEKLTEAFRRFDLNGDGVLSRRELTKVLHSLQMPKQRGLSNSDINAILEKVDKNDDGHVQFEEFAHWITKSRDKTAKHLMEASEKVDSPIRSSKVYTAEEMEAVARKSKRERKKKKSAAEKALLSENKALQKRCASATGRDEKSISEETEAMRRKAAEEHAAARAENERKIQEKAKQYEEQVAKASKHGKEVTSLSEETEKMRIEAEKKAAAERELRESQLEERQRQFESGVQKAGKHGREVKALDEETEQQRKELAKEKARLLREHEAEVEKKAKEDEARWKHVEGKVVQATGLGHFD
eukprot:TRINITY_DN21979_c0_g2_i1.p1 TRINITY_DN21979_c0_g2~~TRINITY_DN21979_c0_g2_i1.p1  ORF type:complete len:364 (+),score=86.44 TRINITY_DN21979_c0_g2_i1:130-1092(+)